MSLPATIILAWLLADALIFALLLSQTRGFVIAIGWLVMALAMVLFIGPALLASEILYRLGLLPARAPR